MTKIVVRMSDSNYYQNRAYREKCRAARTLPKAKRQARRMLERTIPDVLRTGNRIKNTTTRQFDINAKGESVARPWIV